MHAFCENGFAVLLIVFLVVSVVAITASANALRCYVQVTLFFLLAAVCCCRRSRRCRGGRLNFIPLLLLISVHLLSFDPFNSRLFCISFAFLTLEILVCDVFACVSVISLCVSTGLCFFLALYYPVSCVCVFFFVRLRLFFFLLVYSSLPECVVCLSGQSGKMRMQKCMQWMR